MNEIVFAYWIIIWVILLGMSTIERKGVYFGFLAGLQALFFGIYIIIDGFSIKTGMSIVDSGGVMSVTYQYASISPPFSSYSTMWGFPFILLGMYIMYLAVNKNR